MKAEKIIPSVLLILIFSGCGNRYTQNETILKAESLLFNYPDSAFNLLNSIKNPEKLSKADYAAWCLHFTHAQYKLYLDIKSDSLIKFAANYYSNSKLKLYSGTAYYLWGCISDINNMPKKAMFAFKKADDFLLNTTEYNLIGLVKYRIGYLLLADEYLGESEQYIDQSIQFFKLAKNNKYLYYAYRTRAEILYLQNCSLSEINLTIDQSEKLSLSAKDSLFYFNIQTFRGKVLLDSDPSLSKRFLLNAFRGLPNERKSISALLSYAYSKLNMPDSALYYTRFYTINKSDKNSQFLQMVANAYVANCKGNKDSAFIYFEKAYNLREKTYKDNIKEQLVRIDKQYDLSKKEAEKAKLEIQNQKNIILIAFLSIMILAILLILLFITNLNKKRQGQLIIEKQKLEFEIKAKQVENDKNLKILLTELQNKIDNTLHFKRIQSNLAKVEKKEEFIAEITRQSVLNNIERQFYIYEADKLFDGRIMNLKSDFPQLTDSDLIVISLICIGIDITNSILLLDYANINTMYIRRNRIKKHLGLDTTIDLDKWLRSKIIGNLND